MGPLPTPDISMRMEPLAVASLRQNHVLHPCKLSAYLD